MDVVPSIIKENNSRFKTGWVEFVAGDAIKMDFEPTDLILVKDVFMHWNTSSIRRFLKQAPAHKYMLVTNDWRPENINGDTPVGRFQSVDLREPPFMMNATEVLEWHVRHPRDGHVQTKKTFLLEGKSNV